MKSRCWVSKAVIATVLGIALTGGTTVAANAASPKLFNDNFNAAGDSSSAATNQGDIDSQVLVAKGWSPGPLANPGGSVLGSRVTAESPVNTCTVDVVTKKVFFISNYAARLDCLDGVPAGWEVRGSIQQRSHTGGLTVGKMTPWLSGASPVSGISEWTGADYGYVLKMEWRVANG